MTASGWFDHDGWWLDLPGDDPGSAHFASAHELHHKQLQDSTSYGAVVRVLAALGRDARLGRLGAVATQLSVATEHVQEAFASWLPAAALGWDRERLVASYPAYARYYDALAGLVGDIVSPYLRFHAAHVVGRVCMQTTAIDVALHVGLDAFALADLRRRDLPDARFAVLRRRPPSWEAALVELRGVAGNDDRLRRLLDAPVLTAELFDPALADVWELANTTLYDLVAAALRTHGCETIEYDGHLDRTPALLDAARDLLGPGGKLDLEPGRPRVADAATAAVLRNIETEGFSVGPPLDARVLPAGTDLTDIVADLGDPHVFVTVRRTAALLANYRLVAGTAPSVPYGAFARRTVRHADGRLEIELLDVTTAASAVVSGRWPVSVATSMSLLREPMLAAWTAGPALRATVVVADLPLAPHLQLWLSAPGARFRYVLLRIESFGRVVPFLVAAVDAGGAGSSPLLVRPLSHAAVRVHKASFEELDPTGERIVEDRSLLEVDGDLLTRCLAHLAGEEVRFTPVGTVGA